MQIENVRELFAAFAIDQFQRRQRTLTDSDLTLGDVWFPNIDANESGGVGADELFAEPADGGHGASTLRWRQSAPRLCRSAALRRAILDADPSCCSRRNHCFRSATAMLYEIVHGA